MPAWLPVHRQPPHGHSHPREAGNMANKLAGHPDQRFAHYILAGLQRGFRIGFNHGSASLRQGEGNMKGDNPQAVADYLKAELEANRLSRLSRAEASTIGVHFSPIGVIPKKGKPGKWWLIVNPSAPSGGSVNDGVDKESIRFSYTSVDVIADRLVALGRGSQLAKMDIKQAYRMIPVHPEDRYLLGMLWEGVAYVDKVRPPHIYRRGGRSAVDDAAGRGVVRRPLCRRFRHGGQALV